MAEVFEFIGMSVVFGITAWVLAWGASSLIRLAVPDFQITDYLLRAIDWAVLGLPSIWIRQHETLIVLAAHDKRKGTPVARPLALRRFVGVTWRTRWIGGFATFSDLTTDEESLIWPEST